MNSRNSILEAKSIEAGATGTGWAARRAQIMSTRRRFEGRVAVITGAAGALGRACAVSLASEGAKLVLFDRDAQGLAETVQLCPGSEAVSGDVRSAADVKSLADVARDRFGLVEMLIAAAGVAGPSKMAIEIEEEEFDLIFDVNVKGSWLAAKYV